MWRTRASCRSRPALIWAARAASWLAAAPRASWSRLRPMRASSRSTGAAAAWDRALGGVPSAVSRMKRAGVRPERRAHAVISRSSSGWKRISLVAVRRSTMALPRTGKPRHCSLSRHLPPKPAERPGPSAATHPLPLTARRHPPSPWGAGATHTPLLRDSPAWSPACQRRPRHWSLYRDLLCKAEQRCIAAEATGNRQGERQGAGAGPPFYESNSQEGRSPRLIA